MQAGNLYRVSSDPATQFTTALAGAGAAIELEDVQLPETLGAGRVARGRVRAIQIYSLDNLAWELWFFGKTAGATGVIDTEHVRGSWSFAAGDGKQIAGAGFYFYYIDGLDIAYEDEDRGGGAAGVKAYLHLGLQNRSGGAKTIGGNLKVRCLVEPTYGS